MVDIKKIINWKSVKEILHEGMGMKEWKNEKGMESVRTDFGYY